MSDDEYGGEWTIISVQVPAGRDNALMEAIADLAYGDKTLPADPLVYSRTFENRESLEEYEYGDESCDAPVPSLHLTPDTEKALKETITSLRHAIAARDNTIHQLRTNLRAATLHHGDRP